MSYRDRHIFQSTPSTFRIVAKPPRWTSSSGRGPQATRLRTVSQCLASSTTGSSLLHPGPSVFRCLGPAACAVPLASLPQGALAHRCLQDHRVAGPPHDRDLPRDGKLLSRLHSRVQIHFPLVVAFDPRHVAVQWRDRVLWVVVSSFASELQGGRKGRSSWSWRCHQ